MNSVCKGAWVLGTACGLCARCKKTVHEYLSCGTKWANKAAAIVRIINEDQKPNQGMNMISKAERHAIFNKQNFYMGDWVRKKSGSQWQGYVVGTYSTSLTPEGYAVESDYHAGSVQIYPASALEAV